MIPDTARRRFVKAGYRIVGNHSAVDVCHWTKESLRHGRVCYKEQWYGIESHRCMEMTPALIWCSHRCLFCWRPQQFTVYGEPKADEPDAIIDGCIEARRKLLTGFKGNSDVDKAKWLEATMPNNAAISLTGEPTLYPELSSLLDAFANRDFTTFLVTNGTQPDRLLALETEPTNLYISLCAADPDTYTRVHRPLLAGGWIRVQRSLEAMHSFSCRTVIRITLLKGLNIQDPARYAPLIANAEPDFVESKGFMHVGDAQKRLPRGAMPSHQEVVTFTQRLSEMIGYRYAADSPPSRVALLSKRGTTIGRLR